MSYDQAIKWIFIGGVALADLVLLSFCNMELQVSDLVVPLLCGIFLSVMSIYYHHRGGDSLVLCMVSLIQLGCYTSVVSVFIYASISLSFPLIDPWLRSVDQWVGFSPVDVVEWTRKHPGFEHWSTWAYLFIVPETVMGVLVVAFAERRIVLEQFVFQFMLGIFVCGLFALFLPAWGPIYGYEMTPREWQQPYVDHLAALCSGERYLFSWKETEGLCTFPSFHTTWAICLIFLWRKQTMWLSIPMSAMSVMIILSTLTTGSHYIVDLAGGAILAAVCIACSRRVTAFSYHANGSPRVIEWLAPHSLASWLPYLRRRRSNAYERF